MFFLLPVNPYATVPCREVLQFISMSRGEDDKFQGERLPIDIGERVVDAPGAKSEADVQAILNDPNSKASLLARELQAHGKHFHITWSAGTIRFLISSVAAVVGFGTGLALGRHEKKEATGRKKTGRRSKEKQKRKPNTNRGPRRR